MSNEKNFLDNYLWPSEDRLDRTFTFPLPEIEGLEKCGDFIVQCELEDTFSTNIVTKYQSDTLGIRLVEVYKNTQNKVTGIFVRLVGTMSLVKIGYPVLALDAPILNVNPATGEKGDITTRVHISLVQANAEQWEIFFGNLSGQAKVAGISYREIRTDVVPDFWGPRWMCETKGVDLDLLRKLRDFSWSAYECVIEQTNATIPFDYSPFQEFMVFDIARREHLTFKKMGLSVPIESQAAFFSVMFFGV